MYWIDLFASSTSEKLAPGGDSQILDEDLYIKNDDLDFYLATPNGMLYVRRQELASEGQVEIGTGFYHDDRVLDKNRKPVYRPNPAKITPKPGKNYNQTGFGNN